VIAGPESGRNLEVLVLVVAGRLELKRQPDIGIESRDKARTDNAQDGVRLVAEPD